MSTSATPTDDTRRIHLPSSNPGAPTIARRAFGRTLAALALTGLGGCYVGVGYTWTNDDPPSVDLSASPTSAAPGTTIELTVTASDDDRVERVEFFRMSGSGATYLGSDRNSPYAFSTTLPDTSASTVSYFARAVDSVGQTTDSEWVRVTVQR